MLHMTQLHGSQKRSTVPWYDRGRLRGIACFGSWCRPLRCNGLHGQSEGCTNMHPCAKGTWLCLRWYQVPTCRCNHSPCHSGGGILCGSLCDLREMSAKRTSGKDQSDKLMYHERAEDVIRYLEALNQKLQRKRVRRGAVVVPYTLVTRPGHARQDMHRTRRP